MSGLMIPKHVAAAARVEASRRMQTASSSPVPNIAMPPDDDDDRNNVTIYSVDRPLPAVVPKRVHPYRMYIMLVGLQNKSANGLLVLPESYVEAQYFNHCLGRIVAMGPCCFKGQRWRDMGYTEEHHPKIGDFLTFNPRAPLRETWSGTKLIIINDDDFRSHPTREEIDHLQAGFGS